ncbi:hypothetical protein DVDV_1907 [Desulfovibrio sp. DV]|uniref:tol-pal system protein YbgF n=1 Tax=Desulfovibrio sp. DV TaxID=1844708 RepID=UPI00094B90CD|nr:tol-pal system protein YbgF [Desulfovibrio sp. DV]OLN27840.1 hypothetical protein DVDV_1907 [Desulfovibrio sp. DV]
MKRTTLVLGALALCLTGLLGACGPANTLALGKGSEDFRLKAVEANLQKAQDDLKALSGQQQQNDAKLSDIQKQLGEVRTVLEGQGLKLPAAGGRGSALGVGFARPGAAVAPEPAAADKPSAVPAEPTSGMPGGPTQSAAGVPGAVGGQAPAAAMPAGLPGGLSSRPAPPAITRNPPPPAAEARGRHPQGRVGPPETSPPATPEAAIAADRGEAGPGPKPTAGQVPNAPQAPSAAPAPVAAVAPQPAAAETPPEPKPQEPAAKGSSPAPGYAQSATPAEKAEYNKALQLAINGRAAEAKSAFDQFLAANPASPLAPNALYWVGEGAFARGDYQTAIADFDKVAKGWPGHHKAADSLYKMAMAQEKAGDVPAARASLERYLKDYPNAELAGVARQKLQALPK